MSFRLFDCDVFHEILQTKVNTMYSIFLCFSGVVSFNLSSLVAVTDVCSKAMVVFKYLLFFRCSICVWLAVSFSVFALHCTLHCAYAAVDYKAVLLLLMVVIAPIGCGTYVLGSCFVVSFLVF